MSAPTGRIRPDCCSPRRRRDGIACILGRVSSQRKVRRYAAYFKGWCQAFGEHQTLAQQEDGVNWLLAENQIGFILPKGLTKALYREVLGRQGEPPTLRIGQDCVRVGEFHYTLSTSGDKPGIDALRHTLRNPGDLHLYLTYHFLYRSGTRIITLSRKQPMAIIYKEISPMQFKLI